MRVLNSSSAQNVKSNACSQFGSRHHKTHHRRTRRLLHAAGSPHTCFTSRTSVTPQSTTINIMDACISNIFMYKHITKCKWRPPALRVVLRPGRVRTGRRRRSHRRTAASGGRSTPRTWLGLGLGIGLGLGVGLWLGLRLGLGSGHGALDEPLKGREA